MSLDYLSTFDREALLYSLSQLAAHKTSRERLFRKFIEKVSQGKVLSSKAASFTGATFPIALNKVLFILAPYFIVNKVSGLIKV